MQARLGMLSLMLVVQVAAAQPLPAGRVANLSDPGDVALLELNGDKVSGQTVVNDCDTPVRPMLYAPAPDMAVVVEADPTACVPVPTCRAPWQSCCASREPGASTPVRRAPASAWEPFTMVIPMC